MPPNAVNATREAMTIIKATLNRDDADPTHFMNDLFDNDYSVPAGILELVDESASLGAFTGDDLAILARLASISFLAGMLYERDTP